MVPDSNSGSGARGGYRKRYCAIDFGTSNSAVAIADDEHGRTRLVALEQTALTMPSAVFYNLEDGQKNYGRAAVAAYVDGYPGRLMRSLKSILGSALIEETTQLGDGLSVRYVDVIAGFLKHLVTKAEQSNHAALDQVVLGRPVYFVDDDQRADARAESALASAARSVGFKDVSFQFEPVAAALDYQSRLNTPQTVLVADIGGGTSDFTVIRLAPGQAAQVLANHGVHVAGTDFDQRVELAAILPLLGLGSRTPEGREVPNRIYYDLATWHLINSVYAPKRLAELLAMKHFYADQLLHQRLINTVKRRLGHQLVARAEQAKIELSSQRNISISLDEVETGLAVAAEETLLSQALESLLERIVLAAHETTRRAGLDASRIDALYFTGGSTGLSMLTHSLCSAFVNARPVHGDRFASVAAGLGIEAAKRYG
jgi:hypothetical chaperone protein